MSFMGDKDAKASGEKKVPFDDNNFRELVASLKLSAYRLDKDKLRRIRAVCSAHTMTCAQAVQLVKLTKGCNCDAAVTCYGSVTDKNNFTKVVLPAFKWAEEKKEVASKIKNQYGEQI